LEIKIEGQTGAQVGNIRPVRVDTRSPARGVQVQSVRIEKAEGLENTEHRIEEIRRQIEQFLERMNKETVLKMRYDKEINRVVVTVMEAGTQKVLRQIPPEEFVSFLKRFRSSLALLFERSI
jgi:flagellar protein FlaG